MSRKTRDLLTKGLSSELFLLAYIEPNNIRKLAQMLQNTSGHPTNYSKASPAIHDLTIATYLKSKQDDDKFYVDIEKLALELENILKEKNISLNEIEKKYLLKLLEEKEFFTLISKDIIEKIQNQMKGQHKINALNVFSEKIGMISAMTTLQITMDNVNRPGLMDLNQSFEEKLETLNELKEIWKEFGPFLEKEHNKFPKTLPISTFFDEIIIPMLKNMPSMLFIFLIPKETLEKLGHLWSGYEGVKMALSTFSIYYKK